MATRGFWEAGLMTSKVRDASASTHSPSMSNWVGRSEERTVVGHHETTLRRGVDAMAGFDVHVGRTRSYHRRTS